MVKEIGYHISESIGMPQYSYSEFVEVKSDKELDNYIATKKDDYGHSYKKESFLDFRYISKAGAIRIKNINIKKL